ncbi:MAG: hypothetical protein R3D59_17750 [Paracoccaceae bacterium]
MDFASQSFLRQPRRDRAAFIVALVLIVGVHEVPGSLHRRALVGDQGGRVLDRRGGRC